MNVKTSLGTSANINGALIAMGNLGIFDNFFSHWIIGLHRAIENSEYALHAEIVQIAISGDLRAIGLVRERTARQREASAASIDTDSRQ